MRRALVALACLAIAAGVLSSKALGQVPASERTLVSDPNQLEKMGFPRDATNVYVANYVGAARVPDGPTSPDFYGLQTSYTNLAPKSFVGRVNTAASPWQYDGGEEGCCTNLSRTGVEGYADAAVNLPEGVNLQFVRWWAYDTNATFDIDFFLLETCWPSYAAGPTTTTVIATSVTSGSGGAQTDFVGLTNYTVNNRDCNLTQRVYFETTSGLTLQKVRYQWQRQVSPAPVVATFTDVPTTHPFFKFVEALYASGITAGCGGGNFCPDTPVTRGQMAVFLSAALGLYWQ